MESGWNVRMHAILVIVSHTVMQVPMGFYRMELNNSLTSFHHTLIWLPESLDETYQQISYKLGKVN